MKLHPLAAFVAVLLVSTPLGVAADDRLAATPAVPNGAPALRYPSARRGDVVDDYFGTKVADPYRWMEDLDSPETTAWVQAEAALTESYLAAIPSRQALRDRLTALWNYERVSTPTHEHNTYVFTRNSGLQNQSVLYVSKGENGPRRVLIDPNALSSDGTVALGAWALSNDGARFAYATQVIAFDVRTPGQVRVVVPEASEAIESVSSVGGRLFVSYLKDARSQVKLFDRDGRLVREVVLPGIGAADGFGGHRSDAVTYYDFTSYTSPRTIYRYDIASGASSVFYRPTVAFDPSQYTTEQRFYASKDGTRVPMLVSYRKGFVKDGSAPTILYGYGGFDISLTPYFSPAIAEWLELGGVYAVPNLRGGAEYGEAWHEAGMLDQKEHVFDDFIAAALWLIDNRYTSAPRLGIHGGSNGGLLCGATLIQRPDLVGAALCDVGVMDMLRYQKFTVGAAWIPEYGASDANEHQFRTLYAYSPLQNLKPGSVYPPTLISTADHDDRVFPAHSFKFAATMQADQTGPAPILLFVESKAGHGGGKPLRKTIDEIADQYAFLVANLNFTPTFPARQSAHPAIPGG